MERKNKKKGREDGGKRKDKRENFERRDRRRQGRNKITKSNLDQKMRNQTKKQQ